MKSDHAVAMKSVGDVATKVKATIGALDSGQTKVVVI